MRVTVDRDSCESNGICVGLVPEVFALDDDDNLRILAAEVPAGLAAQVRYAVRACPKAALTVGQGPAAGQAMTGAEPAPGQAMTGAEPAARQD